MLLRTLPRGMNPTTVPATPERRGRLLRKPAFLSRRTRSRSENTPILPTLPALPAAFPMSTAKPTARRQPCVALLNEVDEDAVIVTALDELPFCCHADLILMPHTALEDVADVLNSRLPLALQINKRMGDQHVRSAIELLVGLREVGTSPLLNAPTTNIRLGVQLHQVQPGPDVLEGPESPLAGRSFVPGTLRAVSEDSRESIGSVSGPEDEGIVDVGSAVMQPLPLRPSKKRKISPSIVAYNWDPPSSFDDICERDELPPRPRSPKRARLDDAFEDDEAETMECIFTRPEKPRLLGAGFPSSPMRDPRSSGSEVSPACRATSSSYIGDSLGELAMALGALSLPSDVSMASAVTVPEALSL
ncbi:unnamed protein product [Peniophora sp. CBMAI 1063]|nr:unnamed protein product [Peniophora sp. CBMAI 1063]